MDKSLPLHSVRTVRIQSLVSPPTFSQPFSTLAESYHAAVPSEAFLESSENFWHVIVFPEVERAMTALRPGEALLVAYYDNENDSQGSSVVVLDYRES